MFLDGTVKPGVITAPIGFNCPRYSLIDKCCEQANGGEGGRGAAPLARVYTLGENAGVLLIIQHVSLIPALVVGTCERA